MGQLDGKVAIVTGSGRGIGREVAVRLAAKAPRVVVNDLDAAPAKRRSGRSRSWAARPWPASAACQA